MPNDISLIKEIQRKLIHFSSGIIPILVLFYGRDTVLPKLFLFTFLFILIDLLKSRINWMLNIYIFFFKSISRYYEIYLITGASWFLLGYLTVLIIFPENIAVFSMLLLSVSDSFAAIIGKYIGKTNFFFKTLEGSFAFLLSGLIISIFFQEIPFQIKIATVIFATIVELFSTKINDNLSIPILSAMFCFLGINIL